mgnify:FL=1
MRSVGTVLLDELLNEQCKLPKVARCLTNARNIELTRRVVYDANKFTQQFRLDGLTTKFFKLASEFGDASVAASSQCFAVLNLALPTSLAFRTVLQNQHNTPTDYLNPLWEMSHAHDPCEGILVDA